MALRTDGVYVQFGLRPWFSSHNNMANDKWYNLIRVFDEKHVILFGNAYDLFYEEEDEDEIFEPKRTEYGITDESNVLQTVYEISKLSLSDFFHTDQRSNYRPDYLKPKSKNDCTSPWFLDVDYLREENHDKEFACLVSGDDEEYDKTIKRLGHVSSAVSNDGFSFYHKGNPNIIYDFGSPGRIEKDEEEGELWAHNFSSYFIPFDLSEEETWGDILKKWNAQKYGKINEN